MEFINTAGWIFYLLIILCLQCCGFITKIPGEINKPIIGNINSTYEYEYNFSFKNSVIEFSESTSFRFEVETDQRANVNCPLFMVIRQQRNVISWQIPYTSNNKVSSDIQPRKQTYYSGSQPICINPWVKDAEKIIDIFISTCSDTEFSFNLTLAVSPGDFIVEKNITNKTTEVSPASPKVFRFPFDLTILGDVLVNVESDDDICMTVAIHHPKCPFNDKEATVEHDSMWQTMTRRALLPVTQARFPEGFFIVFVVHDEDSRCEDYRWLNKDHSEIKLKSYVERRKTVVFKIEEQISPFQYSTPILIPLLGYGFLITVTLTVFVIFYGLNWKIEINEEPLINMMSEESRNSNSELENNLETEILSSSARRRISQEQEQNTPLMLEVEDETAAISAETTDSNSEHFPGAQASDNSSSASLLSRRVCGPLLKECTTIKDLVQKDSTEDILKHSKRFYWIIMTVAVYYALPVLQLLFNYDAVTFRTGDHDLCYYNFGCSQRLGKFEDFNHVYSNIGYIVLGIFFITVVFMKKQVNIFKDGVKLTDKERKHKGALQHYGIYYAMGFALVMEGVLSAAYHVCPNTANFQFDTAFMYVISVLSIVNIYKFRHPLHISSNVTFVTLAIFSILSILGLTVEKVYFVAFFTVFHIIFISLVSVYLYYIGYVRTTEGDDATGEIITDYIIFKEIFCKWWDNMSRPGCHDMLPAHKDRILLPVLALIFNAGIIVFHYCHQTHFASHLLYIFVGNFLLYVLHYGVMKIVYSEYRNKYTLQPLFYLPFALILWMAALFCYTVTTTSWEKSPAQSRIDNYSCVLLKFYDYHDLWHFLSAAAIFCSYMILLTLDDAISGDSHNIIPVI